MTHTIVGSFIPEDEDDFSFQIILEDTNLHMEVILTEEEFDRLFFQMDYISTLAKQGTIDMATGTTNLPRKKDKTSKK